MPKTPYQLQYEVQPRVQQVRNTLFDLPLPETDTKLGRHPSKEDRSTLRALETPASDPMLGFYLEEGQPGFTDRLVHGQPVAKKTRIKRLETILKSIERTLAKPNSEQGADLSEVTNTIASGGEAEAVQEGGPKED